MTRHIDDNWQATVTLDIEKSLRDVSDTLASLYKSAIDGFSQYDPSNPAARITLSHACYSMRDLMNDLPDSFPGDGLVRRRSGNERTVLRALVDALGNTAIATGELGETADRMVIEKELVEALKVFYEYERQATEVADGRAFLAVSHPGSDGAAALIPWKAAHRFFQAHCHVRSSSAGKLPSASEVRRHVEVVNNVLELKVGHYFATKDKVRALLDEANASGSDGTYAEPSEDLVSRALSCLGDIGLRFVFYNELSNPNWVIVLERKGVFSSHVGPSKDGGFAQWPEGGYLSRMAELAPGNVCRILVAALGSDNPYVIRTALSVAAKMPAGEGEQLLGALADSADRGACIEYHVWDGESVIAAVECSFMGAKRQKKAAEKLARHCLMPKSEGDGWVKYDPIACIPSYQYETVLSHIVSLLPDTSAFGFVNELICAYTELRDRNGRGYSGWWLPSVEGLVASGRKSIIQDLVCEMERILRHQLAGRPDLFRRSLGADANPVVRRIALHVLGDELAKRHEKATDAVLESVEFAVNSDAVFDSNCDAEFFPLARAAIDRKIGAEGLWSHLSKRDKTYEEGLVEAFTARGIDAEEARSAASDSAARRRHRALGLIGKERLPLNLRGDLEAIESLDGEVEYEDRHVVDAEWVEPISPLSVSDMESLGPAKLISHLEGWRGDEDGLGPCRTREGQAAALSVLVRDNPKFFSGHENELERLSGDYVAALLRGWDEALMQRKAIPVDDALFLCSCVAQDAKRGVIAKDRADNPASLKDPRWAAVSLLGRLPGAGERCGGLFGMADAAVDALIAIAETDPADAGNEESLIEGGMDELNVSANQLHSEAVAATIDWLDWIEGEETICKAGDFLKSRLPDRSPSIADASAFAMRFSKMEFGVHEELRNLAPRVYGGSSPNRAQKTALAVTLATHSPNAPMMKLLSGPMQTALELGATGYPAGYSFAGEDTESRIGMWILLGFIHGVLEMSDGVFSAWDQFANIQSKRFALERTCHSIGSSHTLAPEVRERAAALYDHYADMASNEEGFNIPPMAIQHLVMGGCFSQNWWLPRLVEAMEADPDIDVLSLMEDEVTSLSGVDPESALRLLMAGIRDTSRGNLNVFVAQKVAPLVIANAIDAGDPALASKVERCKDEFGFLGLVNLDDEIDQAREAREE